MALLIERLREGAPARTGPAAQPDRWRSPVGIAYLAAVLLGSVLCVVAALQQPFSYDEHTQIRPYPTGDVEEITGATRQPPLAPLAEAFLQRVLGGDDWTVRLLPLLSGIGCLVLMAALLRRHGLRWAGAGAMLAAATTPLLVRYSAYNRPYVEALVLMLLFAWAAQAWLEEGRVRHLVVAVAAAFVVPLVRVPEPAAFLFTSAVVLAWSSWRRGLPWRRTVPLGVAAGLALATVGLHQVLTLREKASGVADTSTSTMLEQLGPGLREIGAHALPMIAQQFSWWPLTLTVVVLVLVVPSVRRTVTSWWPFWPLLAAPVAFLVAYHLSFQGDFEALPYRNRSVTFLVPVWVLAVAAIGHQLEKHPGVRARLRSADPTRRWLALGTVGLLVALLAGQAPGTTAAVTRDAAPDFKRVSHLVHELVPDDAILLYDRTTPAGASRQHYPGRQRYLGDVPHLFNVKYVGRDADELPEGAPVYLLYNGQCAYPGRCVPGRRHAVDYDIPGWHVVHRKERFTLYAPDGGGPEHAGPEGTAVALEQAARAMGPELGYLHAYQAAIIRRSLGQDEHADRIVSQLEAQVGPELMDRIEMTDDLYGFLDHARG